MTLGERLYLLRSRSPVMKRHPFRQSRSTFVDTPRGIFTDSGIWFRTREAWLRSYAGEVFDREPVDVIIAQAELWLRSAQALTLAVLPALLLFIPPINAALASLVLYVAWKCLSPSFVSRRLVPIFRALDFVPLQAIWYIVLMSLAAINGEYVVLAVGLGGFILLRWGVVRSGTRPIVDRIQSTLYTLPAPDHVLRAFIVRAALSYRITIPDLAGIEKEIVRNLKRRT